MSENTKANVDDPKPPVASGNTTDTGSVEPASENKPSLGGELRQFLNHVDCLADTLPGTMMSIDILRRQAEAKLEALVTEVQADLEGKTSIVIPITDDNMLRFTQINKQLKKSLNASKLTSRSLLVSLVSQYDAFLGSIIRAIFILKPDTLNISERQISYAELIEFPSIEAARDHIIEKEVETVLRKSHAEQFDWLETKFGLPLRKDLEIWPQFIELTERRNLFVHNSGTVSQQYLDVCKKHEVKHSEKVERGQELNVSLEYFNASYRCLVELGGKLVHTLWRKLLQEDRKAADGNLNQICYELLVEEKYVIAKKLLDFSVGLKKYSSEQYRRMFFINRAQAYKWSGDDATAKKSSKRKIGQHRATISSSPSAF